MITSSICTVNDIIGIGVINPIHMITEPHKKNACIQYTTVHHATEPGYTPCVSLRPDLVRTKQQFHCRFGWPVCADNPCGKIVEVARRWRRNTRQA